MPAQTRIIHYYVCLGAAGGKEWKVNMKWVCKVCGYVYEGDELPEDYVCPLCGVGPEEFEKVEE